MAFVRPTLASLVNQAQQDFVSRLGLVGAVLRRSVVAVLARVIAGTAHMLYGHLDFLSRQLFADQSEAEYLERQGGVFGVTRNPAAFATGNVTFTGTNGIVIPSGAVLRRSDAVEYRTTADATLALGTATASVIAQVAALAGSCDAGTVLTFESPIAGVTSTATVAVGGLSGGTDPESDDDYRVRVLERIRSAPQGGAASDYVTWAKEVPGVTRAFVYPQELGAGTVTVRFVRDDDASLIPDAGEVAAVQAYIDARRPVTAAVTVVAPVAVAVAFSIDVTPDTTATRAAVTAELADLFRRLAEPGVTLLRSQVLTSVGNAEGVTDFAVTVPAADVPRTTGQISTLGVITWL